MLDTLRMFFTQFFTQSIFVFIIEIERRRIQDRIFLNNFVEDVNVQRQSFCTFKLFDQFPTNGTSHTIFMMKLLYAACAQGMTTVNKDARDPLSHVVLQSTELANVQLPRLVVKVHNIDIHFALVSKIYDYIVICIKLNS